MVSPRDKSVEICPHMLALDFAHVPRATRDAVLAHMRELRPLFEPMPQQMRAWIEALEILEQIGAERDAEGGEQSKT